MNSYGKFDESGALSIRYFDTPEDGYLPLLEQRPTIDDQTQQVIPGPFVEQDGLIVRQYTIFTFDAKPSFDATAQEVVPGPIVRVDAQNVRQTWTVQSLPISWAISNADLRRALAERGLNPALITGYLNSLPEGQAKWVALADWEYANYFERSHPLLDSLAPAFGMTGTDVDGIFRGKPAYPRS
jgi:hypothetical protein